VKRFFILAFFCQKTAVYQQVINKLSTIFTFKNVDFMRDLHSYPHFFYRINKNNKKEEKRKRKKNKKLLNYG